jgi:simple sugar transport system substrate-binding protein
MSQEPKPIERRNFLGYTAAGVVGLVVGAAGTYLLVPPGTTTTTSTSVSTSTVTSTVSGGGATTTVTSPVTTTVTAPGGTTPKTTYTIWMADHGNVGSSFWAPCYKGVQDAINWLAASGSATINFKHTYTNEDYSKQADDLKAAVASKPDGILFTIPSDPTLLDATVRQGVAAGIPFIALNAYDQRPIDQMMPYLFYVGENAQLVGPAMGVDLNRYIKAHSGAFTPKNALLCNPVSGHIIWETRLRLYGQYMTSTFGTNVTTQVTGVDTTKVPDIVRALLTQYPNTDLISASGGSLDVIWPVLQEAGKTPGKDIYVTGFDPTALCMTNMSNGTMVDCFDQQQYLQGFIPMEMMYEYLANAFAIYGTVATGPFIINETNVAGVINSTKGGFR